MGLFEKLFPKKEEKKPLASLPTKRFDFGHVFKHEGITYKYLYTQYGKDVFYRDNDNPCIVLFKSEGVTL